MATKQVVVPKALLERFTSVADEVEDYILASDPAFVAKMRKARKQHLSGKLKPFTGPKHGKNHKPK